MLAESQEHNDLVVEDFHDVYLNLTMKTGFLLKWLNQDCPRAKFVLKVCNLISLLVTISAQRVPEPDLLRSISFDTRHDPIQF